MQNPHNLFLIDGLGAVLSALSLGLLLPYFNMYIGMPSNILHFLALPAVVFAVYSLSCYFLKVERWRPFLRAVAIANLLYCCLTIFLMGSNGLTITSLGVGYFFLEIMVILVLAYWELRTVGRQRRPTG